VKRIGAGNQSVTERKIGSSIVRIKASKDSHYEHLEAQNLSQLA
jgi:hypothetical protein